MRLPRWAIPLPAIILSFFPFSAKAEDVAGLNAIGYRISSGIPTKSDTLYTTCGSEIENNINRSFDGEPFQQCGSDNFMVHYTGAITIPENATISFMVAADDGGTVQIGDKAEFGTWNLKGCSWSTATNFALPAGQYPLEGWYFESGGNACYMLAWSINGAGWQIVPDDAFTTTGAASTTSTSTTTLTSTSTTTTTTSSTTTSVLTSTSTTAAFTTSSTLTTTTVLEPGTTTTLFATTSIAPLVQETSTTTATTQLSTTTTPTPTEQTEATTVYIAPITTPLVQPVETTIVIVPTGTLPQIEEVRSIETTSPPTTTELKPKIDISLTTDMRLPETVLLPNETVAPPTSITVPFVPRSSTTAPTPTSFVETTTPLPLSIAPANLSNILLSLEKDSLMVTISDTVDISTNKPLSDSQMDALLQTNLTSAEFGAVFSAVFDDDLTVGETLELAELVFDKPLSNDEFKTVIDAIFDEAVSDELLVGVFGKLLDTELDIDKFADLVNVLNNADAITVDQVAKVVDLVLAQEEGVSESQATELASSAVILESIGGPQAGEIFNAIVASDLSIDEGSHIVESLLQASSEVREAFEAEINVFEGVFDDYVPSGSVIDVGTRRAIVAGVAVVFVTPMTPVSGGSRKVKS